ncbi:MAG TPA: sulfur carrier protein ThiS [Terriglobales bacterium]|nr:sulfur carrier protein ThiS [Terriglobales bacterium]
MRIQINGEGRDCLDSLSVASLLEQLGMKRDRVAVELNRAIVPREKWDETGLSEGDRLEIVHFVGGGCTLWPKALLKELT